MSSTAPTLTAALAGLLEVARAAGVEESVARAEAESLSATVAESATGAWADWSAQTGGGRSAQEFTEAAARGRRWRSTPTPTLARLAAEGAAQAPAYARGLALVCTAAAGLGAPTAQTIGNASRSAAAQLGAFRVPAGPPPSPADPVVPVVTSDPGRSPSAADSVVPVVTEPNPADELERGVRHLWGEVMGQLSTLRTLTEELRRGPLVGGDRPGSPFDLDPSADPWAPGAFPDLTGGGNPAGGGETVSDLPARTPPTHDTGSGGTRARSEPPQGQRDLPDQLGQPDPPPEPPEPKRSIEELLAELDDLTGLAGVKGEIHRQVAVLRIEAKRAAAGLKTPDLTRHLVFTGNPGTGKTTVARLVGGIYQALGLLSKGQLVEVDRSELVAGYLGQTAMKTVEVVASATGGVLFIDEAYSLAGDQYGTEAVDTLVKEMEDKRDDLVVIVAGYPVPMQFFIAQNPGLASRFRTTIDFVDYSDDELVAIFTGIATTADYDVSEQVQARFRELLAGVPRDSSFGNGRYARNVFEAAVGHQAWRLREVEDPTIEQLRSLAREDLVEQEPLPPDEETVPPDEEPVPVDQEQMLHTDPDQPGEEPS